jgi:superfamily II DNA or RNA helicase
MSAYIQSLLALRGQISGPWEVTRWLDPESTVSSTELAKLVTTWNRTPVSHRHELCLRLRSEHPAEFARAARFMVGPANSIDSRLRCAMYLPELWPEVSDAFAVTRKFTTIASEGEFQQASDDFLESLPGPLYELMLEELADGWWWRGQWTRRRIASALRSGNREVCVQLAMLAGDAKGVAENLGAEQKRAGYAIVWDFLRGQSQPAYLALNKMIGRRKEYVPVFNGWVAMWARLIALSQGDGNLFNDRRLSGNVYLESAFGHLSLNSTPSGEHVDLEQGLSHCGLWIARQFHPNRLRLPNSVRDYWQALGLELLAEQLQEHPSAPLLPKASREEPWQTFVRLLDTQSELLGKPAATSSKGGGALLWHLFAPEIVFYNDKSAAPELGPEKLAGKHVNSKALFTRMPNYLNDQDRVAMAKVRFSSYGGAMLNAEVLRALVGHPRVYQKERRIELREQPQQLRLEREDHGLRLRLWPEIPYERDYLLEESGRFWTRSPLEKQLQPLLHQHAPVPVSAEKELRTALSKWAERIDIEVGEGLASLQQAQLKVDQLALRARPQGRGMRFDWLVSCSQRPDYQRPAFEGREQERVAHNGAVTLFVRDLAWEQQQFDGYLRACPSLPPDTSFRCESLHEVLDLLQECQEAGVSLEWPEGSAWRVRRASALNVAVSQAVEKDWFNLEGGLQLEQGDALDLQTALAAARLAQGSFLKLGENDFVRISTELREQLAALADLADAEQPRVPALAVPTLAELELAGLSSDQAFQERLANFQECADFVAPVPRRLEADLRDYQVEGFRWLARHARMGTGACLADDMGLGKTLQAIALMLHLRAEGPHLVVCPLSVLAQWAQQIEQFAPTLRVRQDRELKGLKAGDVVLCSYGVLLRDIKKLSKLRWSVAVLDEAQAIKNPQSKTARSAYQLQARVRLATTGTPIENRMSELWSLFAFLNPGLLGTLAAFRRRYEEAGAGRSRLRGLIAPFVLRRMKSQVLTELPPRTEVTLKVPLGESELALYEQVRAEAQRDLEQGQSFELLAHLTRLRQACCHPRLILPDSKEASSSKLEVVLELVERLSEGHHRALIFSQFTRFLDLVEEELGQRGVSYQRLDGSTPVKERQRRVEAFQDGEGEVFLISLKAGGTGLNLTGADYVIHLDPWWNPAAEDQASDRAHRIGQRRPVTVYRLVAENTLEEKVVALHGHKRELAQSVLEGSDQASPLSLDELRQWLRMA